MAAERDTLLADYKATADAFAKNRLHSRSRYLPNEKVTLRDFAEDIFTDRSEDSLRHHNELFGRKWTDHYYKTMDGWLRNYILRDFGDCDIRRITDTMIESWYIGLVSILKHDRLADSTRLKILDCFDIVMERARKKGLIERNPCEDVDKIVIRDRKKRRIFTKAEIALLFPNDRSELMRVWNGSLMWALYFSIRPERSSVSRKIS